MLAIGLVLDDWSREAASEACGMDRQTLCDWVHRYNALGLEGLSDRPRRRTLAVSMNFGPLVLTNFGPPSGV